MILDLQVSQSAIFWNWEYHTNTMHFKKDLKARQRAELNVVQILSHQKNCSTASIYGALLKNLKLTIALEKLAISWCYQLSLLQCAVAHVAIPKSLPMLRRWRSWSTTLVICDRWLIQFPRAIPIFWRLYTLRTQQLDDARSKPLHPTKQMRLG